jgi:hypothetical protein
MQRFYLVASDPDGEMDAEPREDDLGEWVLHRDAQAEVDRLQSDLRTAIDERDRAVADLAAERLVSDVRAAEVEALRWAIDESGVLIANGTLAQQLIAAAKRKLGVEP